MSAPLPAPLSPRTVDEPMAFTAEELVGGVLRGAGIFAVAAPVLTIAAVFIFFPESAPSSAAVVVMVWFVVVLPAALVAALVFTPVARAVGWRLRRERRRWPHLLSYGALGACAAVVAGAAAGLVIGGLAGAPFAAIASTTSIAAIYAPVAAVSTSLGWYLRMRSALRADH